MYLKMSYVDIVQDCKSLNLTKTKYIPYQVFIKKYTLGTELRGGGFGVVYTAKNSINDRSVAVKFVPSENVCTWELLNGRSVPIEVVLLTQCQSVPGVIRLHHYTKCRNNGFLIAMERLPLAVDLFEYTKQNGPVSELMARNIFRQIVEIIQACAKQGVVHLDIKLENIIVDAITGKIKLIDFGSGAWLSETPFKRFSGTWLYAAPEWFLHREFNAIAATVWSLGVLLYTILVGKYPFRSRLEITENSLEWRNSNLSFKCQELIQGCLASKPEDRLALEDILCQSWLRDHERNEWKCVSLKTATLEEVSRAIESLQP